MATDSLTFRMPALAELPFQIKDHSDPSFVFDPDADRVLRWGLNPPLFVLNELSVDFE